MHRYCRSRNFVEKHASAIQSTSLKGDYGLDNNFRESVQVGLDVARSNRLAAALAFIVMLMCAIAYATVPFLEPAMQQVILLKIKMGPLFAFLGMGLSVGFLSEFIKVRRSVSRRWTRSNTVNFLFLFLMFGVIAAAKDPIYYLLANLYGEGSSFSTLLQKVFFDQFAWTLLLACPAQTFLFAWKAHGFSSKSLSVECPNFSEFFALKVLPALLAHWSFWLPTSVIIFCFPTDLQLAASILAMNLWLVLRITCAPSSRSLHPVGK
ncbi:MAG TPA: hypothetical protein DEA90_00260 [Opitutae bacterium]|nr:hypothetical protein [Puniceicoccaceae bacterium]HBR92580.1 hypothetical protein [Opitutae bacterium]|tara:strand:+ start:16089 stop:16883 length:795 start_codon:yes stop_codon:yes gene_type:complete